MNHAPASVGVLGLFRVTVFSPIIPNSVWIRPSGLIGPNLCTLGTGRFSTGVFLSSPLFLLPCEVLTLKLSTTAFPLASLTPP